jgi:hypothetical protein
VDTLIEGPAAWWLARHREALNTRFARAKRRFPGLDSEQVSDALRRALPPLAGPEPASDALLSSVFDLVLLHAGRGTLASKHGIATLLYEGFPVLRTLLLLRPEDLPAGLSNAVENLSSRGHALVARLSMLAASVNDVDELLSLGAVVAWRLGEARLREPALGAAERVSRRAVLAVLDLDDWAEEEAPRALDMLREHAWQHPRSRGPAGMPIDSAAPLACWKTVARRGDFAGFGGDFPCPPLLLDAGDETTFFVRCGGQCFRLEADLFGWSCRIHADLDAPVHRVVAGAKSRGRRASDQGMVVRQGWLERGSERAAIESLARATSFVVRGAVVATTHADSHRIRITVPVAERA